jgi:hypothetical protein
MKKLNLKHKKVKLSLKEAAVLEIYQKDKNVKFLSERHKRRLERIKKKIEVE